MRTLQAAKNNIQNLNFKLQHISHGGPPPLVDVQLRVGHSIHRRDYQISILEAMAEAM